MLGISSSLNIISYDYMVGRGALSGRLHTSSRNDAAELGAQGLIWAGNKVGGWSNDFCQYAFGVDGKTVADRVGTAVLVAFIAAGVYQTGKYILNRESNSSKVKRALSIWSQMNTELKQISSVQELQDFIYTFKDLESDVYNSYNSLSDRYGSWVKPWNWTADMQIAYTKMQLVSRIFRYKDILLMNHESNESELITIATGSCSMNTAYPICAYVEKLNLDIKNLKSFVDSYKAAAVVLEKISHALQVLVSSQTYVAERRALEDAIARQRLIDAVDRRY